MSKFLPLIVTVVAAVGAAIFTPSFISTHPALFAVLAAAAQVLHAALPSIFTSPSVK